MAKYAVNVVKIEAERDGQAVRTNEGRNTKKIDKYIWRRDDYLYVITLNSLRRTIYLAMTLRFCQNGFGY